MKMLSWTLRLFVRHVSPSVRNSLLRDGDFLSLISIGSHGLVFPS